MRLPMKPSHTPATTTGLADSACQRPARWASTSGAVAAPRTTSNSFITAAGLKKCRPRTCCGRCVTAAISSTFRGRGVGGQHGLGLGQRIQAAEHRLLERHVLEHGLDDQVAVGQRGITLAGASGWHAGPGPAQPQGGPLSTWACTCFSSAATPRAQGGRIGFHQGNPQATHQAGGGNATAHGASPQNGPQPASGDAVCRPRRRAPCPPRARQRRRDATRPIQVNRAGSESPTRSAAMPSSKGSSTAPRSARTQASGAG